MALAPLCWFSATSSTTHNQIGSFWCCFLSGWICIHSRTLWVSPMNFPVRLGVFPAATSTPTGVFNQRFEALFPCAGTSGCAVCHPVHQLLPRQPAATLPTPLHNPPPHWVHQLPPCHESSPPDCPPLPLLPVWMKVSSLSPQLSDFHTVQFFVSSGYFLFLNCCCPSFGCVGKHSVSTYASILAGSLWTYLILKHMIHFNTLSSAVGYLQYLYLKTKTKTRLFLLWSQ